MSRFETTNLPVILPGRPAQGQARAAAAGAQATSTLEAQRLGQERSSRGLRGGRAMIDAARTAYLSTQWSGADDRRPPAGLLTRTRV